VHVSPSPITDAEGLLEHVFPLRESLSLRLALPKNLSVKEASRLALYIKSLAID
jgi:hypothetical protein